MVSYKTMTEAERREYAAKSKAEANTKAEEWKRKHPTKPTVSKCVKDASGIYIS